jgi:glycosyltransferase involved in cell wall biosynthesis
LLHNRYQQLGGEDGVFHAEKDLLTAAGHRVLEYVRDNDEIAAYGLWQKGTLALRTVWAWDSYREIQALLRRERPDVAHFHNTFPLVSPAAYYACREAGVPVVQTLHNYRLLCPAATLQNDGRVCEECLGRSLWRGVWRACYRDSRAATAATALMLSVHRWLGTWSKMVDCYIALTEFARAKFIEGGLPAEKIVVKPNFVHPDPMKGDQESEVRSQESAVGSEESAVRSQKSGASNRHSAIVNPQSPIANHKSQIPNPESPIPNPQSPRYALFVGRLAPEKGVRTLLAAWRRLGNGIPLEIVGDGPLRAELEAQVSRLGLSRVWRGKPAATSISFHGRLTPAHVIPLMKCARFLVFPSECYEGMPRTIIEAFACGVPVIASRLGAMQEIVEDGRTGLHFTPGDPEDLAAKVEWAWTHPNEMQEMGRAARAEYEFKYTAERNYQMLMDVYERVLGSRR